MNEEYYSPASVINKWNNEIMKSAWVYILKCSDGSYYTGKTQNLERRMYEHEHGIIKGYTSTRLPVKLVFTQEFPTIIEAIQAERQVKGWTRAKKEALIRGDFDALCVLSECRNESHFKNRGSRGSFDGVYPEQSWWIWGKGVNTVFIN